MNILERIFTSKCKFYLYVALLAALVVVTLVTHGFISNRNAAELFSKTKICTNMYSAISEPTIAEIFRDVELNFYISSDLEYSSFQDIKVFDAKVPVEINQDISTLSSTTFDNSPKRNLKVIEINSRLKNIELTPIQISHLHPSSKYDLAGTEGTKRQHEYFRANLLTFTQFQEQPIVNASNTVLVAKDAAGDEDLYETVFHLPKTMNSSKGELADNLSFKAIQKDALIQKIKLGQIHFANAKGYDADFIKIGDLILKEEKSDLSIDVLSSRTAYYHYKNLLIPVMLLTIEIDQDYIFKAFVPLHPTYSSLNSKNILRINSVEQSAIYPPRSIDYTTDNRNLILTGEMISGYECIGRSDLATSDVSCSDLRIYVSSNICNYHDLEKSGLCYEINEQLNNNLLVDGENHRFTTSLDTNTIEALATSTPDQLKLDIQMAVCYGSITTNYYSCSDYSESISIALPVDEGYPTSQR